MANVDFVSEHSLAQSWRGRDPAAANDTDSDQNYTAYLADAANRQAKMADGQSISVVEASSSPTSLGARLAGGPRFLIDASVLPRSAPSYEDYQRILAGLEGSLRAKYTNTDNWPDLTNYRPTQTYATILIAGEVVATIDNQGCVTMSDSLSAGVQEYLLGSVNGTNGPNLAKARAEQLVEMLGGQLKIADTAMSQIEFDLTPNISELLGSWVDEEAMRNDPFFETVQNLKDYLAAYPNEA